MVLEEPIAIMLGATEKTPESVPVGVVIGTPFKYTIEFIFKNRQFITNKNKTNSQNADFCKSR